MADIKDMARTGLQKAQQDVAVKQENSAATDLREQLEKLMPRLAEASVRKLPPEFIISTAMTLLRGNDKLRECTPLSIIHGILQSAQLGLRLDPALGHAALVPRRNRSGQWEAQFMPMYKGLLLRAQRTGKVVEVVAQPVYANDTFTYSYGRNAELTHVPAKGARGDVAAFYAYAKLANGGFQFEVMTVDEVTAARDRGGYRAGSRSPWDTDFMAMGRKTVLKRLLQLLPVEDTLLNDAVRLDDMAEHGVPQDIHVDTATGEVVYNASWQPEPEMEVPAIQEAPACICNDISRLGDVCPLHGAPKNVPIAESAPKPPAANDGPIATAVKQRKVNEDTQATVKKLEAQLGPLEPVPQEQADKILENSTPPARDTYAGHPQEFWVKWAHAQIEKKVENRPDAENLYEELVAMQKRGQITEQHLAELVEKIKLKLAPPAQKKRAKKAAGEIFDDKGNAQA